ncbi:MAG: Xylose isomerase-like TIM barrel [Candidatus Bathyarchaeota archaeon BA1]|nr:MAG: Xylose isomerase-like TIM barrel [Candidatus Bathyarchaeota archaeon BA1]
MLLNLAHRYTFPEQKPAQIHELYIKDLGSIELAFHKPKDFLKLNHVKFCRQIMDARWISVYAIHLPALKLDDVDLSSQIIGKAIEMSVILDCQNLVIHPPKITMERVEAFLNHTIEPLLESSGARLCWETFLGGKRLFHDPHQIAEFVSGHPGAYAMCYDTAHMKEHGDVIRDLREHLACIGVLHASNRTAGHKRLHLPIFHSEGVLDFSEILRLLRKAGFGGLLVLEYAREFWKEQLMDYGMLKQL